MTDDNYCITCVSEDSYRLAARGSQYCRWHEPVTPKPPTTSQWCQSPREQWTVLGKARDGSEDVAFEVDQRARCEFERRKGHDWNGHRYCCWGPDETESRDCACPCHTGCPENQHKPRLSPEKAEA